MVGLISNKMNVLSASKPYADIVSWTPGIDGSKVENWHEELTKRIDALDKRGGGTLELGDGEYEIDKPLLLPNSVSLMMTPCAVIRAKAGFMGDAVIIKGGGENSRFSHTGGWIRGGVIDGGRQPITGLRIEQTDRMEIADLVVLNATYKGIHLLKGGYETNISRVRCDVDLDTKYAPGSIGIHYERNDSLLNFAHIIGYETGLRSDGGTNFFTLVHVWNRDSDQGPMLYNYYCNGPANTFNQCYADSPTIAGFYINKPHQSIIQCRVYYSRWAKDNSGAGFLITPEGIQGNYIGNVLFADGGHRLARAFDGDLSGSCILGTSCWGDGVLGGFENRIPSGELLLESNNTFTSGQPGTFENPKLNLAGKGFRLDQQIEAPLPEHGEIGEVRWVDDNNDSALWIKTTRGWKKSVLS
jgi:hypothetical protein